MKFESYKFIDEGIVYGIVEDINNDKIYIKAGDEIREFDNNSFMCKKGDYVRVYIKNNKIIYLEVISKDLYDGLREIINE